VPLSGKLSTSGWSRKYLPLAGARPPAGQIALRFKLADAWRARVSVAKGPSVLLASGAGSLPDQRSSPEVEI